jgi:hypothetical protein
MRREVDPEEVKALEVKNGAHICHSCNETCTCNRGTKDKLECTCCLLDDFFLGNVEIDGGYYQ